MTKEQLLNKWRDKGIEAARRDDWMTPRYEDDFNSGIAPLEDLLMAGREGWEATSHFQTFYGGPMYYDALDSLMSTTQYPNVETVVQLKIDLIDVFWDAWEIEIGAPEIIARLREDQPKRLADKMLDLLEIVTIDGKVKARFTEQALDGQGEEFSALIQWMGHQRGHPDFLFDQALYMLDYVAHSGLDNLEDGFPEPDIYTMDLTHWLAGSVYNINYITEVLVNPPMDAIDLLQQAQCLAISDTWMSLAQVLRDLLA